MEQYVPRYLVYSLIWSFSGDGKMKSRDDMGNFIRSITTIPLPSGNIPVIDYEVHTLTVYLATYITLREVEVLRGEVPL